MAVWKAINIVADGEKIDYPILLGEWVAQPTEEHDEEIKDTIIEELGRAPLYSAEVITYDVVEAEGKGFDDDIHFFARSDYGCKKYENWWELYDLDIPESDKGVYIGKWYYEWDKNDDPTTDNLECMGMLDKTLRDWLGCSLIEKQEEIDRRRSLEDELKDKKQAVMLESIKNTKTEEYLKKQSKADQKVIQQLHNKNKKLAEEVMKLKEKTKWCLSEEMIESTSADSIEEFEADVRDNWKELENISQFKAEVVEAMDFDDDLEDSDIIDGITTMNQEYDPTKISELEAENKKLIEDCYNSEYVKKLEHNIKNYFKSEQTLVSKIKKLERENKDRADRRERLVSQIRELEAENKKLRDVIG